MASIASTIESLEEQSCLIRDMIKANWNVEYESRRAACRYLFHHMFDSVWSDSVGHPEIVSLRDNIEKAAGTISELAVGHPKVMKLTKAVEACCRDRSLLRHGWVMAGWIASLRLEPDLALFFQRYADEWLAMAPSLLEKREIEEKEIVAVPLMFYVIGDLDRAIDCSTLLIQRQSNRLSEGAKAKVAFNRVTFMVEREYHYPTNDPASRQALRKEIDSVLDSAESCLPAEHQNSILDTRGFVKVTFAHNQKEARQGIDDFVRAASLAPPDDREVAGAYLELNVRLGWRRYFDLEITSR